MVDRNVLVTTVGVSLVVSVTTVLFNNYYYYKKLQSKLLCDSMPQ
jgi:hypothetical protein